MKGIWIGVCVITCFAVVPAEAQDEKDFEAYHDAWLSDDADSRDDFAWMNDFDLSELPELPDLTVPMFESQGDFDDDAEERNLMVPDDDELKITKDQREKMRQIRQDAKKQNIPLEADVKLKRIELQELMRADNPSKDKIAAKVKEIEAVKTQMKINRLNSQIDVRGVLSKEQRDKMQEMRSMRKMHWKGFPGTYMREGHDGPRKMKRMMR